METTSTARPRRSPRVRGSVRGRDDATGLEGNYDLLTAALLGVAIGVGATLLLRRGPSGRRPIAIGASGATLPLRLAGRQVAGVFSEPPSRRDVIERQVRSFMQTARDRIDDAVESELRDLRGAVKRQRRRLGL
jgi:alkanesulfonate monooxygenase SsuD/methylene tetrahydromethanopterin reductase-like flavin-dependent oxidoreductase (luciferase family)